MNKTAPYFLMLQEPDETYSIYAKTNTLLSRHCYHDQQHHCYYVIASSFLFFLFIDKGLHKTLFRLNTLKS